MSYMYQIAMRVLCMLLSFQLFSTSYFSRYYCYHICLANTRQNTCLVERISIEFGLCCHCYAAINNIVPSFTPHILGENIFLFILVSKKRARKYQDISTLKHKILMWCIINWFCAWTTVNIRNEQEYTKTIEQRMENFDKFIWYHKNEHMPVMHRGHCRFAKSLFISTELSLFGLFLYRRFNRFHHPFCAKFLFI